MILCDSFDEPEASEARRFGEIEFCVRGRAIERRILPR